MNMQAKIQHTMRENERFVMRRVRRANKAGALFNFWYGHTLGGARARGLSNALRRLIESGRVVFLAQRGKRGYGYRLHGVRVPKGGWKVVDCQGRIPGDPAYMG